MKVFDSSPLCLRYPPTRGRFNASAVDQKRQSSTRKTQIRIELISLETRILLASHVQMVGRWDVCLCPLTSRPALLCFRVIHINVSRNTSEDLFAFYQRWSRGHKARGQGQRHQKNPRPRPRTVFPRTDALEAKDRNARGQGQGPRTQAQVLSKKKKGLHKNFSGDLQKKKEKGLHQKFFKRSTKFSQFKKYCCPRAEDRPIFEDLKP